MINSVRGVAKFLFRFAVLWIVDAISLQITAAILPGISLGAEFGQAMAAALMLGVVNILIRPLILLLSVPLGFFVTFAIGAVANALALLVVDRLLPGFEVNGLIPAFLGGLFFSFINTAITAVLTVDDEDSFYQGVVERLAARQPFAGVDASRRGLVMMEIDGLSYFHMQKAIDEGWMPTLKRMRDEEGYVLSHVDCGLPSQTSACQAGIMFGDNYDIPAFRWYDKDEKKLFVSGHDAPLLNARYAKGHGLMRGGSSINNLLNGDAEKSILTMADLSEADPAKQRRRAEDIYLLMLNPYFFMRTLVLFIGDAIREVWEYRRDVSRGVQPRLDRLHHFYPAIRAATTVFMRDVSAYLTILDIVRGSPSIYVTWPGYDEVAHHSGPWSKHAFRTLTQYDRAIARVRDIIERKAPRPYELIILSDHGQSFGATFLMRYGVTLKEFIEQQLPQGTLVLHTTGGDDGSLSVTSVSAELNNLQQQGVSGTVGRTVVKQAQRATTRATEVRAREEVSAEAQQAAQVTVCGSGNIAQVYFQLYPRKITLNEFAAAYPGLVDSLVQHEGVGFVVGYADDGAPVALGKRGQRNLHTGAVSGDDPLLPYGDPELRARQIRRIADFPHAGDLMVNSSVFPDRTVAAMEELIGCHGGLGGEQTDAFLFHPGDMRVPPTSNSVDVFPVLNARRELPAPEKREPTTALAVSVDAWSPSTLATGLGRVGVWLSRALRAMVLDRSAYREVAQDKYMTGPAVLIGLVTTALLSIARFGGPSLLGFAVNLVAWPLAVLVVFGAGRLLGGRVGYTATLRVISFARTAYFLMLLALVPDLAPLTRIVVQLWVLIAAWTGSVEAFQLRGWRSLVFPLAVLAVIIVSVLVIEGLVAGAAFTLDALGVDLGLIPAP